MLTERMRPRGSAAVVDQRSEAHSARPVLLVLTEDSKPALGGIAEMLHRLAGALAERYDVRIVSSVAGASDASHATVSYEEVSWFRARTRMRGDESPIVRRANTLLWYATRDLRVRRLLRGLLAAHRPEWVLLFRLSAVTEPWARALRRLRVPYDVVTHGMELIRHDSLFSKRRLTTCLRGARRIFAVSEATSRLVRERGVPDSRVSLVHPGIDPESLAPPPDSRRLAEEAGATGGRRYILSICTLVPRKGITLALRAFAEIAGRYEDLHYVIAGKGEARATLEALAQDLGVADRVHLIGPTDDEAKLALLANCEFFVLPNRRLPEDIEGFGIVFLEANMFGKAVIGGANGGVVDAVEDGVSGLLVDTSADHGPLVAAMRQLLDDPSLAHRLGAAGRCRAVERFTWRRAAQLFLDAHSADVGASARSRS